MSGELAIGITEHAMQRARERLRIRSLDSLTRTVLKAMELGMPRAEAKGGLLHWLDSHSARHQSKGNMTMIHRGVVFIIHNRVLITVLYLPEEHRRQVAKWHAKKPPAAKSSGSLKDPQSGTITPKAGLKAGKRVLNALKSPDFAEPQPGGEV